MNCSRLLCPIEDIVSMITINLMISFEAKTELKHHHLVESVRYLKRKYPYLSLKIVSDQHNRKRFSQSEHDQIDIVWNKLDSIDEFKSWESRFNRFSCVNYDFSKSLFYFEIDSFDARLYRLFFSMNHSGTDSRGNFAVLKDLIHYLDSILTGTVPEIHPKPFLDVLTNLTHPFDLDQLRQEAHYDCKYHNNLRQLFEFRETDEDRLKLYRTNFLSEYFQFDEETSRRLFSNCRDNRTSVQAVLSVANMLALINEDKTTDLSGMERKTCLHSIPIDMRYHFGLEADDLIKGSAFLVWVQELEGNQELWEASRQSKSQLERLKSEGGGLKWWVKTNNNIPRQPYISLASSIGLISFDEHLLRNLELIDLRFNNTKEPTNLIEIHAFTFQSRLTLSAGFRYPQFRPEWTRNYLSNLVGVLTEFSNTNGPIHLETAIRLFNKP